VHGHTDVSDGKGSVEEFLSYARDVSRLDFVIVTDHDFGNGPPWRMPAEAWRHTQEAVDAYTVDGTFVAIAGYEWTSQPKYWSGYADGVGSEGLFDGPPKFYNHKNVYFPSRIPYLLSAKDSAYMTPDLLARAVLANGGLIHNNHPSAGPDGRDQWDYDPEFYSVITNTEIAADVAHYNGQTYALNIESTVRGFLNDGGRTGFVSGTDTHEGHPAARTAVFARELSRDAIFEALRHRRNYATSGARIVLHFTINGHYMGEEIETPGKPRLKVEVEGTDRVKEVAIIRDGVTIYSLAPGKRKVKFEYVDNSFEAESYYYVRVTQADTDEEGNLFRAWSSPIWVKSRTRGPTAGNCRSCELRNPLPFFLPELERLGGQDDGTALVDVDQNRGG
jgi:hypothetical protein